MFRERDLVSTAPLQRWDPELPGAPAEAGENELAVGNRTNDPKC